MAASVLFPEFKAAVFENRSHLGHFFVVLRDLAQKVGRVQIFGWEFSRKLSLCCVGVIPTFLQVLRKLFFRVGGIVLYSPGRRKSRDYSVSGGSRLN